MSNDTQTQQEAQSVVEVTTDRIKVIPNVDPNVDMKPVIFRFKKDKLGNKRPDVEGKLPIPSPAGIVGILEKGGKGLDLLLEALFDVVRSVAQEKVSNDENIKSVSELNLQELTWDAIASMSKEDRRSSSIPNEMWEGFVKDYIDVMPGLTGKSVEAVTNATIIFLKKFTSFKTDKDVLRKLKTQLGIYMETQRAEEFKDILDLLDKRADTYLAADDVAALKENL